MPYDPPYFKEARLKIERAGEHMQEFDAYALKVFKGNRAPYWVTSEIEAESGDYVMKYFASSEIVGRFAILCGDIIHNLSAALDYTWYELTAADSPDSQRGIRFPIYPTRKHLEDFIESRKKQQSIVRLSRKLLETIQPYKGGNVIGDLLYALHQLDRRDKHRLLIPQVQVSHVREVDADDRTAENIRAIYGRDLINTYGAKDKHQGELAASIIFGEGALPVEGKPVRKTLDGLKTAVEVTLVLLEEFA
jgi:hypothetical protein